MDNANSNQSNRGRPPIGKSRMVTVGVRVEPEERKQLEALAADRNLSLCAFLREMIREELQQAEPQPKLKCV